MIYFDNAATTPVREEVLTEMTTVLKDMYGNPSSIYGAARQAKKLIEKARGQVADAIGADKREIIFTGSGTEADNQAIRGVAEAYKGKRIITQKTEHHAVLHTLQYLEKQGFDVVYLDVDEFGRVDLNQLRESINEETILISIMFANNEIGTIQPIAEIGEIARQHGVLFHTDAVQAVGHVRINVNDMKIDLLTISAHKLYGPKGVGALYVRKGVKIPPLIYGGAQERGKRAGTENVAGIVGFGKAIELLSNEMEEENRRVAEIRDKIIDGILPKISHCRLNGHRTERLPGNANISFEFIEGESILLMLDMKGIQASSGSACTSGSLDPSHVLLAIGLPHEKAHGSLRLTVGKYNSLEDADRLLEELPPIVERLREMSPLYQDFLNSQWR